MTYFLRKKGLIFLSLLAFTFAFSIWLNQLPQFKSFANNSSIAQLSPEIAKIVAQNNIQQPARGDVRLLVISDLNSAYGSTEYDEEVHLAIKMIPFWQPDLVLCSGDMIAGQKPSLTPAQIRAMWQSFEENIAQPIRKLNVPFGFTVGNHDASSALAFDKNKFLFQQERDLAVEYWQNPSHDPQVNFLDRSEFPFYYTFTQDDIYFLVWDGSSSRIPPDKLEWVVQSLASPQAQNAKMRVIIGHLPLYGVAEGRDSPGEVLNNAEQLRQLMVKYRVHTYISGHHHAYYPGHKEDLQFLHTGALGGGPRTLIAGNNPPMKTITVVDINFDDEALTSYTTYNLKNFELVNSQQLPRLLMGHNGMVIRRDLNYQDLTSVEQKSCVEKFGQGHCE